MQSDKPALIRCARIWREDTGDFAPGAILVRSGRIADLSAVDEPAPEGAAPAREDPAKALAAPSARP